MDIEIQSLSLIVPEKAFTCFIKFYKKLSLRLFPLKILSFRKKQL